MSVNTIKELNRTLKELRRDSGDMKRAIRMLQERNNHLCARLQYAHVFDERTKTGTVITTHGTEGGGTLPGSVGVDQRGELSSAVFTMAEGHGLGGTLVVQEASALAEEVQVI